MEEELKKQYETVIKSIENAEAEIECIIRQKQMSSLNFTELIKSQSKLKNAEKLIRNILDGIEKYKIIKADINQQIQIANQSKYQKKQYELDKKYRRDI